MKIAVTYICTGNYEKFWDGFYSSCEKYFYPGVEKVYFVFTESNRITQNHVENVHTIYQKRTGWPYDTLLRFHWFSMIQDELKKFDHCYYFNANSLLLQDITESVIPLADSEEPLIFWCHTQSYDDYDGSGFHPERNPLSTAYVKEGDYCRCFGGGFFGGTSEAFLKMTIELRDNIQDDLEKGIIAVWHDQSHIIKYGSTHPHKEVGKDLICQEEKNPVEEKCVMVYLAKDKNGGKDNLRGNIPFKNKVKHCLVKIYAKILSGCTKMKIDKPLRKLASCFKNRQDWYK